MKFSLASFKALFNNPQFTRRFLEGCILFALITVIIGERTLIAAERRRMPAGDVFNFQHIARHIRQFDYPLQEKRLPGYPLMLLIGTEVGFDPTQTGIAVSIISSAATTAVLYLLGRRFGFPPLPLALVLLLTSVAPLLTVNGVRPLSDSFFMFLIVFSVYAATIARPTKKSAILTGLVFMYLAFTRYEGIPTALLLLLLLRFRMSWKLIAIASLPLIVAGILWLPVAKKVHGSLHEFGYFRDAQEVASVTTLPAEYMHVIKSSGFGEAWDILESQENTEATEGITDFLRSPAWWLSVLANFGVLWLVVAIRSTALPFLLAALIYPILPAWWFLYSRFVAPMTAFYYFTAAAGAAGVWAIVRYLLRRTLWPARLLAAVVLGVALVKIVLGVAPGLYKDAQARSWENNGNDYAQYLAFKSLENSNERVAIAADYPMTYIIFGNLTRPKDALNNGRGVYLSTKPDATVGELAEYLRENKIEIVIDDSEPVVAGLVAYLRQHENISHTQTFAWPRQDGYIDTTHLHYLQWP